jgi:mevalonate kinase
MGEHAAVYGRPALIAAIDLRLRARFSAPAPSAAGAASNPIVLDLPCLGHYERLAWDAVLTHARAARASWSAYSGHPSAAGFRQVRGGDPAHVVKVALGEAALGLGDERQPPLHLRIDSELPIGSGFGSSAAAAVAIVAGYLAWRAGAQPAGEPDRIARIARIALEVERRQHGMPSGVDTATTLHGGLLWARKLPSGELESEPLPGASPLLDCLRVYDTGAPPESTGEVVAAVRERRERDPAAHDRVLDRMEAASRGLREELAARHPDAGAADRAGELIRRHQACLEELGVVPAPVSELVRQVEAAGGAAKVSGAGSLAGPGAGCLLVFHPRPDSIAAWSFLQPLTHYSVHLGAAGYRQEAHA